MQLHLGRGWKLTRAQHHEASPTAPDLIRLDDAPHRVSDASPQTVAYRRPFRDRGWRHDRASERFSRSFLHPQGEQFIDSGRTTAEHRGQFPRRQPPSPRKGHGPGCRSNRELPAPPGAAPCEDPLARFRAHTREETVLSHPLRLLRTVRGDLHDVQSTMFPRCGQYLRVFSTCYTHRINDFGSGTCLRGCTRGIY